MHLSTNYRVVIDTNVFISALLWNGTPDKVLQLWRKEKILLLLSPFLLAEIFSVLERSGVTNEDIQYFTQSLENNSIKVIPMTTITLCRDPKDNEILSLAVDGDANYIITGDRDLLTLGIIEKTTIVKPKDFLQMLL